MRILFVDDSPRRYQGLLDALSKLGIPRDDSDFAPSAMDARAKLSATKYDLMVLDILLPLRAEADPEERHSRELLTELIETDELNKPKHIVGISAYSRASTSVAPFFRERLWTVVTYSEQSDEWITQIANCVRYLMSEARIPCEQTFELDVAIVCALEDPELRALFTCEWNWQPARPIDDVTFVYDGLIAESISVVAAAATRKGMVESALLSAKLIEVCRPRLLIMTGICAGVRGKTSLGDAILIDPSWDYQSGKQEANKDGSYFSIAPHQIAVEPSIRSRFDQLRSDRTALSAISNNWLDLAPSPLRLLGGPVASGSAVLANSAIADEVRQQHRELCGIEMEAYGVYSAARSASFPRPAFFALKSVCDFADGEKNDAFQRYAAYTSAHVVDQFLRRYFSEMKEGLH